MTHAQLSVIAEAAAAAVVGNESVQRAVREAVWEAGEQFVPLTNVIIRDNVLED